MLNTLALAVDSGRHSTKGIFKINGILQRLMFRTKGQKVENLSIEPAPNSFLIEMNGESFLVGDMVSEQRTSYEIDKTSIDHLLSTRLMTCLYLEKLGVRETGIPINLAVNLPLNMYKNSVLKNEHERFIVNDYRPISMNVNGKSYIFRYDKCIILPEGTGSIYSNINDYRDKRVSVFDIGSLNVNFATFQSLVPILDSLNVSTQGSNILRSKVSDALTTKYNVSISDSDCEQILKDGYLFINGKKIDDSGEIIDSIVKSHIEEIINLAKSHGVAFNNTTLLFCGGGSILMKNEILSQLPSAIIDSAGSFANALSFLRVLEAKNLA